MLRVTLLGNLGADPETRYSAKGSMMVSVRVAVNQVRTGLDGERQENTEWFRVRVMGRQAEFTQRLSKGSRVLVVGRLDISHYQSREGEPRTGFDVWADEIQSVGQRTGPMDGDGFMDAPDASTPEPALAGAGSGASSGASNASRANGRQGNGRGAAAVAEAPPSDLEDLPF
jgi:single-strand DNA-binding protein